MKLTEAQKKEIKSLHASGMTQVTLAERYSVSESTIRCVIKPDYMERQRQRAKRNYRKNKAKRVLRGDDVPTIEIPDHVRAEWLARAIEYSQRTNTTAIICNDPLSDVCALYNEDRR